MAIRVVLTGFIAEFFSKAAVIAGIIAGFLFYKRLADVLKPFTGEQIFTGAAAFVITSYSIHYTKLYESELDAEGDIVVGQGIAGKNEGSIRAGKSIWAKFIENCHVEAGEFVIVSDGIINSNVTANRKILCQGKRAAIIGGSLSAAEEIHAKTLGSFGGASETLLSVGFDPKSKERLDSLSAMYASAEKELEDVQLNFNTLVAMKKQRKELPEDKEAALKKLGERQFILQTQLEETGIEMKQIQDYLNTLKNRGKVSASVKVFAGVKVAIRDITEDVRSDCKATTFYLENGLIRYGKYQGPDEDMKRVPSGYTAD